MHGWLDINHRAAFHRAQRILDFLELLSLLTLTDTVLEDLERFGNRGNQGAAVICRVKTIFINRLVSHSSATNDIVLTRKE